MECGHTYSVQSNKSFQFSISKKYTLMFFIRYPLSSVFPKRLYFIFKKSTYKLHFLKIKISKYYNNNALYIDKKINNHSLIT